MTDLQECVLQGMGEPLNNYEAVRSATSMMIDPSLFSLRRSKVTISTVGIVPRILQVHPFEPFCCSAGPLDQVELAHLVNPTRSSRTGASDRKRLSS